MTFSLEQASLEEAIQFHSINSAGTAFQNPMIAKRLDWQCDWWFITKGSEKLGILPTYVDHEGNATTPDFSYFFGPYFSNSFLARPVSSQFADRQKIFVVILHHLRENFGNFKIELGPRETDVRAFLWWNDAANLPRLRVTPRYSAQIDSLQITPNEVIEEGFRTLRRREIRRAYSTDTFSFSDTVNWPTCEQYYKQVLERSGSAPTVQSLKVLRAMSSLTPIDESFAITATDTESGNLASMIFCIRDKRVSNLVLNLTQERYRKSGIAALTMRNAILRAKELGDTAFDFNGANSPNRGDDKHSYGAKPVLYFQVEST